MREGHRGPAGRAAGAERRSDWNETRQRILHTAHQLFSERGFRDVTVKEIAATAGVADLTLYRHFKTKAALIEEAAIEPINAFLRDWIRQWTAGPVGSRDVVVESRRFYETLVSLLSTEQKLVGSLAAATLADDTGSEVSLAARGAMGASLDELAELFATEARERGYTSDPTITPRLIMGMALGVTIHQAWLFGKERQPTNEQLVAELSNLTVFGLAGAPRP